LSNADIDDYQKGVTTAKDITGGLTGIVQGLSSAVRNMGIAITAASGIAAGAMASLASRAARVNEAFREVDTITASAASSQERYGELVSDLNTEMGLNADRLEVIDGLYKSLSAGIDGSTDSQRAFLESAARLSVVGRTELKTSVDVLSTAMNAYGQANMSAERASDALFATVQFGKTTLEELAPVMGRVIALGSDMQVSIEELGASMAVLTRTGFESRIAATGLRAVLRGMMKPSQDLEKVLRDIALEQNLFSEAMGEGGEQAKKIAQEYKNVTDSLNELETAQKEAREAVENNSLKIQRARLAIQAIEQERVNQIEDTKTAQLAQANSIEELQSKIEKYRFELNEARVQEESARQKKEELEEQAKSLRQEFKNALSGVGDLQGGIGQLVVKNEGLIETLTKVRERAQEQGIAMSDLFDRSRGLQAALALLGDDGEELNEIFQAMKDDNEITQEEMAKLEERFGTTREEIEELREGVTEVSEEFENTKGSTQSWRDAVSELQETMAELGQAVLQPLMDRVMTFSDMLEDAKSSVENMSESVRANIGTFLVLATAIGLVLGPILLLVGQIALIATAMGSMFIPFALTAGSVLGILAQGLIKAAKDGKATSDMFQSMRSFLSGLISGLRFLKNVFVQEVVPGMVTAGQGIIDVFSAVFNELSSGSGEGESLIRQFASAFGSALTAIGNFLSNNADRIANFVGMLVDAFVNKVIPAVVRMGNIFINDIFPRIVSAVQSIIPVIVHFGNVFINDILPKIISTIQDVIPVVQEMWRNFTNNTLPKVIGFVKNDAIPALQSLANGAKDVIDSLIEFVNLQAVQQFILFLRNEAIELVNSLTRLVDKTGTFLSKNDDLIAKLIIAAGAFGSVVVAAKALIPVLAPIGSALLGLGPILKRLAIRFAMLLASPFFSGSVISSLVGGFGTLGSAIVALVNPITLLIAVVGFLAAAWATDFMGMRKPINNFLGSVEKFGKTFVKFADAVINRVSQILSWFFKFGGASATIIAAIGGIALAFKGSIQIIKGFLNLFAGMFDLLRGIMLFFMGDFDKALKVFEKSFRGMWKGVKQITIGSIKSIIGLLGATVGVLIGLAIDIVKGIIGAFWKLVKFGVGVFQEFYDMIVGFFNLIKRRLIGNSIVPEMIQAIIDEFLSLPGRIISGLANGLGNIISEIKDFFVNLGDAVFERAKKIPQRIADGIKNKIGDIKDAANNMASEITDRLPFSPAPKGPLSDPGPRGHGEAISKGTAEGIRDNTDEVASATEDLASEYDTEEEFKSNVSLGDIDEASGVDLAAGELPDHLKSDDGSSLGGDAGLDLDTDNMDVESDMNQKKGKDGLGVGGEGVGQKPTKKIVIDEKAVYFEKGAFQGVSDEEIPQMVEEEVDESLNDIVEEQDGAGLLTPR
jgi:TP901 family phage tail tape measure protein